MGQRGMSHLKFCGILWLVAQPAHRQPIGYSRKFQAQFLQTGTNFFVQRCTQMCRFLSQEVRETRAIFVALAVRIRPLHPRDFSLAKFKFVY